MADKEAKERADAAGINANGLDLSDPKLDELQKRQDKIDAKGYLGTVPDPTPNENYTTQTPPDAPTPETDDALWHEARAASHGNPKEAVNTTAAEVARAKGDKKKEA